MSGIVVFVLRVALSLCLYGFLIWAMVTIWRDLRNQGKILGTPPIPDLTLEILDSQQTNRTVFNNAEITIGRSMNSDYPIPDETVSARHARLRFHHNQWWVEDLKSTNGSFLNDERINGPTVVVTGDELRCGQINLLIAIAEKSR